MCAAKLKHIGDIYLVETIFHIMLIIKNTINGLVFGMPVFLYMILCEFLTVSNWNNQSVQKSQLHLDH